MKLYLYNTMTRSVDEFVPLEDDRVGLYACGPTVYNYAHIGNLRSYIFEDTLRRTIAYAGYGVSHVMNVTDVGHLTDDQDDGEDKMIKSSREMGKSVWEIAEFYTDSFFHDTDRLHILRPHVTCRATEHIDDMIALIARLEEKGHTYTAGGNVYFAIDTFPTYGQLAQLKLDDLHAGARIEVDEHKRNPKDFVLWFTKSKFENQVMLWDSPWGRGYPGWHIECSAMSMKYLGEQFDIHCGGIDHIAVHHTNEIAQSEAATGKQWVRWWCHSEFLLDETGKMSKSKGEFLTLDYLVSRGFDPMDYRYFCLGAHYRSQLRFSFEALEHARNSRRALFSRILELRKQAGDSQGSTEGAGRWLDEFREHASQDLNMPRCLSALWGLVKDASIDPACRLAAACEMDQVFGFHLEQLNPEKAEEIPFEMMELIREREEARKAKDYSRADEIRAILLANGIEIKDTPSGTSWRKLM